MDDSTLDDETFEELNNNKGDDDDQVFSLHIY